MIRGAESMVQMTPATSNDLVSPSNNYQPTFNRRCSTDSHPPKDELVSCLVRQSLMSYSESSMKWERFHFLRGALELENLNRRLQGRGASCRRDCEDNTTSTTTNSTSTANTTNTTIDITTDIIMNASTGIATGTTISKRIVDTTVNERIADNTSNTITNTTSMTVTIEVEDEVNGRSKRQHVERGCHEREMPKIGKKVRDHSISSSSSSTNINNSSTSTSTNASDTGACNIASKIGISVCKELERISNGKGWNAKTKERRKKRLEKKHKTAEDRNGGSNINNSSISNNSSKSSSSKSSSSKSSSSRSSRSNTSSSNTSSSNTSSTISTTISNSSDDSANPDTSREIKNIRNENTEKKKVLVIQNGQCNIANKEDRTGTSIEEAVSSFLAAKKYDKVKRTSRCTESESSDEMSFRREDNGWKGRPSSPRQPGGGSGDILIEYKSDRVDVAVKRKEEEREKKKEEEEGEKSEKKTEEEIEEEEIEEEKIKEEKIKEEEIEEEEIKEEKKKEEKKKEEREKGIVVSDCAMTHENVWIKNDDGNALDDNVLLSLPLSEVSPFQAADIARLAKDPDFVIDALIHLLSPSSLSPPFSSSPFSPPPRHVPGLPLVMQLLLHEDECAAALERDLEAEGEGEGEGEREGEREREGQYEKGEDDDERRVEDKDEDRESGEGEERRSDKEGGKTRLNGQRRDKLEAKGATAAPKKWMEKEREMEEKVADIVHSRDRVLRFLRLVLGEGGEDQSRGEEDERGEGGTKSDDKETKSDDKETKSDDNETKSDENETKSDENETKSDENETKSDDNETKSDDNETKSDDNETKDNGEGDQCERTPRRKRSGGANDPWDNRDLNCGSSKRNRRPKSNCGCDSSTETMTTATATATAMHPNDETNGTTHDPIFEYDSGKYDADKNGTDTYDCNKCNSNKCDTDCDDDDASDPNDLEARIRIQLSQPQEFKSPRQSLLIDLPSVRSKMTVNIDSPSSSQMPYTLELDVSPLYASESSCTTLDDITAISSRRNVTLYDCMDAYVASEKLYGDNAWHCHKCQKKVRAEKRLSLWDLPEILIVTLMRFEFDYGESNRMDTPVKFPVTHLDMNRYLQHRRNCRDGEEEAKGAVSKSDDMAMMEEREGESTRAFKNLYDNDEWKRGIYDLEAVSHHDGSARSGHYTAHARAMGRWVYFNDSSARPATAEEVAKETVSSYVLVYRRRRAMGGEEEHAKAEAKVLSMLEEREAWVEQERKRRMEMAEAGVEKSQEGGGGDGMESK